MNDETRIRSNWFLQHRVAVLSAEFVLVALLALLVSPFSDYGRDIGNDVGRWSLAKQINLSLGVWHRGGYPYFSEPVAEQLHDAFRQGDDSLFNEDLSHRFSAKLWPQEHNVPVRYRGGDSGAVYLIYYIWKLNGRPSFQSAYHAFQVMHLLAAASVFAAAAMLGVPLLAAAASLVFLYSQATLSVLGGPMHYALPLYVCCWSTLLLLGILSAERRSALLCALLSVLLGCMLAFGCELRGTIAAQAVAAGLLLASCAIVVRSRRAVLPLLVFVLAFAGARSAVDRLYWSGSELQHNASKGHVRFHAIWAGLGEFPNSYGFEWKDDAVRRFVHQQDPEAHYSTPAYERILAGHLWDTLRAHPFWFAGVLAKRASRLAWKWCEFLPGGGALPGALSLVAFMLVVPGAVFLGLIERAPGATAFLIPAASGFAGPLFVFSAYTIYNLTAYLAVWFAFVYSVSAIARRAGFRFASPQSLGYAETGSERNFL